MKQLSENEKIKMLRKVIREVLKEFNFEKYRFDPKSPGGGGSTGMYGGIDDFTDIDSIDSSDYDNSFDDNSDE